MKRTELTNHYWEETGAYTSELKELTNELVPTMGRASTLQGELIRSLNNLYYEYCNNGNMNALNVTTEEVEVDDFEWEEEEVGREIADHFNNHLGLICRVLMDEKGISEDREDEIREVLTSIQHLILFSDNDNDQFSDRKMHRYDTLADLVVDFVLRHRDEEMEIPAWYKN